MNAPYEANVKTLRLNGTTRIWMYVDDLPRSVKWYTETLQLQSTHNIGIAYFFPINEQTELALCLSELNGEILGTMPSEALDLACDDILGAYELLRERGECLDEELQNPAGNYYEFFVSDPDRNKIRIHGFKD